MFKGPHFKHADTRLLVAFGLLYVLVAVVAWLTAGPAAVVVLLGVVLLLLAGLALHLHRERQAELSHALNHTQALVALHTLLEPRRPLPPFSGWAASAELAATLVGLVLERKPQRVLELGSGASSVVIGYALERVGGGRLLSLDHDADYGRQTSDRLERHGLSAHVEVRHAPLVPQQIDGRERPWYDLSNAALDTFAGAGGIDLVVVDGPPRESDPEARYPALPLLLDHLAPDAVIVLDDALRDEEQAALRRWTAEVPGLTVEVIPTPKGVAVVRRTAEPVTS